MKKFGYLSVLAVAAAVGAPSVASAGAFLDACYEKSYRAAVYSYGRKLVKSQYYAWDAAIDNGPGPVARWRHPPVYIETSRLVTPDYYIMQPRDAAYCSASKY